MSAALSTKYHTDSLFTDVMSDAGVRACREPASSYRFPDISAILDFANNWQPITIIV